MNQKNKKSPDAYISVGIIFLLRDKKDSPRPHDAGKSNSKLLNNETERIFYIYKASKGKEKDTQKCVSFIFYIIVQSSKKLENSE